MRLEIKTGFQVQHFAYNFWILPIILQALWKTSLKDDNDGSDRTARLIDSK